MRYFTIYGNPVAKGRPRLGKWGTYTPEKTVNYENLVQFSYLDKYKKIELLKGDLSMNIHFYFCVFLFYCDFWHNIFYLIFILI